LHYAAHYADARLVAALLKARADPNARNEFGSTPLAEAAMTGDAGIIGQLLKAGADVESANPEGQTALMVVARAGKLDAAKLLLKHGADVNAKEQWGGQSALMWAAAQSHPEMIRLLVRAGADVNARGAIREWQRRVTSEPRPKGMNHGGFTPLLYAAREGCVECARELLAGKADINLADPEQTTPLVLALMNLHFNFASFLINAGADVDRWDLYGQTPLYVALDMNTLPIGGRPDLPSEDLSTGLVVAGRLLARRRGRTSVEAAAAVSPTFSTEVATGAVRRGHAADARCERRRCRGREAAAAIQGGPGTCPTRGITPLMVAAGMATGRTRPRPLERCAGCRVCAPAGRGRWRREPGRAAQSPHGAACRRSAWLERHREAAGSQGRCA
jgi:ankyrin repeat protein